MKRSEIQVPGQWPTHLAKVRHVASLMRTILASEASRIFGLTENTRFVPAARVCWIQTIILKFANFEKCALTILERCHLTTDRALASAHRTISGK